MKFLILEYYSVKLIPAKYEMNRGLLKSSVQNIFIRLVTVLRMGTVNVEIMSITCWRINGLWVLS